MKHSPWLVRRPTAQARFRLYCFSYAGGNAASYLPWQAGMPSEVEICAIQLPGRGTRFGEPALRSFPLLIDTLVSVISSRSDLPFAFFGHSLGALLAFETSRQLQQRGLTVPRHLFVSASNAPRYRTPSRRLHELDDDALIAALKDYNGAPAAALENRELMALMLPIVRADFALISDYHYLPSSLLQIPITVFAGNHDTHVNLDTLQHWKDETTAHCEFHYLDGDHFFIHSHQQEVLDQLRQNLASYLPSAVHQ